MSGKTMPCHPTNPDTEILDAARQGGSDAGLTSRVEEACIWARFVSGQ
ncbi:hypothetical protein GGR04_002172 [Aureimonas pseudogalii]|uniref:Uncharacterized protein n=1 Tax=Aureimonas pseudogalii TaxID=1744844 RepID=A0A7W6EBK2_9HYPH|nr:hypothetical protein [Aureimonas pseudogalii]